VHAPRGSRPQWRSQKRSLLRPNQRAKVARKTRSAQRVKRTGPHLHITKASAIMWRARLKRELYLKGKTILRSALWTSTPSNYQARPSPTLNIRISDLGSTVYYRPYAMAAGKTAQKMRITRAGSAASKASAKDCASLLSSCVGTRRSSIRACSTDRLRRWLVLAPLI